MRGLYKLKIARKLFVGGNWKSNGNLTFLKNHINLMNSMKYDTSSMQVAIAPVFIHLMKALELVNKDIIISAQNSSFYK